MPKFNASQTEAINARNQNILISAAAGSGKTTVMVEKIKETLIRHPEASISQFLVITFTKDAAQNMTDACRYDSTIPGCRIAEIDHKRRMEITRI